MHISLNYISDIKDFVQIANKFTCCITVSSGPYNVDAKSILGLLSLDLSKPVEVIVFGTDDVRSEVAEAIAKYIIKD